MERKLILTEDGSHTIGIKDLNTHYHSIHGAVQESNHVFINAGLGYFLSKNNGKKSVAVFEMGFGTGLNALLTLQFSIEKNISVYYQSVELFPLEKEEYAKLNYTNFTRNVSPEKFLELHDSDWEKDIPVKPNFTLRKSNVSLLQMQADKAFDIIFFDAFDPKIQPELWEQNVFETLYKCLNTNGIFVTYSSKGNVRRALQAAGFTTEKIPGPPHKREMLRAVKR